MYESSIAHETYYRLAPWVPVDSRRARISSDRDEETDVASPKFLFGLSAQEPFLGA
jgi:hypothetical protein